MKNICQRLLLYFHDNSHHHYHYHRFQYHCKMYLDRLRILLTIPLDCNMIPCLFQLNFVFFLPLIFFSSLIPSFPLLRPVKGLRIRFRCSLYTYIYIYSYLHFLIYTYLLILIYTYLFILMFSLYYYVKLIKLLKCGEYRNYDKIF